METNTSQTWEDLVFENRNRQYGAYVIRRSYESTVVKSSVGSLLFAVAIWLYPLLIVNEPIVRTHPPNGDSTTIDSKDFVIEKNHPEKLRQASSNKSLTPIPVKDSVANQLKAVLPDVPLGNSSTVSPDAGNSGDQQNGVDVAPVVATTPPPILDFPEIMPQYKGGLQAMTRFIQRNLKYPHGAKNNGTEGKVFVRFVVNQEGKVVNAEIVRGISTDCDGEAQRVINAMPDWIPGEQHHTPVSVRMIIPINFRLSE